MTDLRGLFSDLVRLEIELWDAVDRRLRAEAGLSMGSFDILQAVAATPSCRVYDIAHRLSITVGGASKAVDRIEANGHCARRSNPDDRRSSLVELTPAGEAALAAATAVVDRELAARLAAPLSPRALQQFGATIGKLRAAATGPGDPDPDPDNPDRTA
jgi:DNA-binding MarR family transcriptional regulator